MVKYFLWLTLFGIAFSCTKENDDPINLPTTLSGEVFTTDEFGYTTTGRDGVHIIVEGSASVDGTTDENGKYSLTNLSTGTYTISFGKDGFGTQVVEGFALAGGDVPTYLDVGLIRRSTTQLANLSATISNSQLVLTGKVNHSYPYNTAINGPRAIFFISGKGNTVSDDNYEQSFSRILNYPDGATFSISTPVDYSLFPPGTTLMIIGYGVASYDAGYLNIESNTTIYPTLSSGSSNVTSIKIP